MVLTLLLKLLALLESALEPTCFVRFRLFRAVLLARQRPLRVGQLLLQQLALVGVARDAQLLRLILRLLQLPTGCQRWAGW